MFRILKTKAYSKWLEKLRDEKARARIAWRTERMRTGNFGDSKSVGGGVFELRVDIGQGYRIYFKYSRQDIILILVGGNKSTQQDDIKAAQKLAKEM